MDKTVQIDWVSKEAAEAEVTGARTGAIAGMAAAALIAAKLELDEKAKGQLLELLRSRIHRGMSKRQLRVVILVALSLLVMTARAAGKTFGRLTNTLVVTYDVVGESPRK